MKAGEALFLKSLAKSLRLPTITKNYEKLAVECRQVGASYEEYLLKLLEEERQQRDSNQLTKRLREARFPQMKTLEQADVNQWPCLNAHQIRAYAEGTYIAKKENMVLCGKHGTGKTHAAIAFGIEACKQGYRVSFMTAAQIVNQLVEARDEKQIQNYLKKMSRKDLLIIDELGYMPLSQEGGQLLFQVISERYERGSMIITTNLAFSEWDQVFGDINLTAAMLDRLTHHCSIHQFDWESIRFKQSLARKEVK